VLLLVHFVMCKVKSWTRLVILSRLQINVQTIIIHQYRYLVETTNWFKLWNVQHLSGTLMAIVPVWSSDGDSTLHIWNITSLPSKNPQLEFTLGINEDSVLGTERITSKLNKADHTALTLQDTPVCTC